MPSECNAARRWAVCSRRSLRLRAQEPPPHADQRLDQSPGAHPGQGPLRMLLRTRAPKGPGGGPHRAQEPCRLGRPQQPAGPLLPLQCRQARCSLPTQEGTTDFRGVQASYARRQDSCVFCALESSGRVLLENELALCIADPYPVTPGHSLVIPRRHVSDGLALHQPEWNAVVDAGRRSRNQIRWAGTVRWSAARPQEPAWPASDHGWPASSARSLH